MRRMLLLCAHDWSSVQLFEAKSKGVRYAAGAFLLERDNPTGIQWDGLC